MVIGQKFAWGHLGKAGGEMTRALFEVFPEVIEFADDAHTAAQHTAFRDRPGQVGDRQLVLNIRRLPSWMLSWHVWKSVKGRAIDRKPSPMLSPHEIANSPVADAFLGRYMPKGGRKIDVWLRTEHVVDDFLKFIGSHAEVTPAKLKAIKQLPRINELAYDKALDHWFTSAHIELMYLRNPRWATVEAAVYGDSGRSPSISPTAPMTAGVARPSAPEPPKLTARAPDPSDSTAVKSS